MGKIRMPPGDIKYPFPKAVGEGYTIGRVIARAMLMESFPNWGDYMRVLDLVEFLKDVDNVPQEVLRRPLGYKEFRFTQFYRASGATDNDWIYGQGAGHMSPDTLSMLIHKAKTRPDFGSFGDTLDKISIL